MSARFCVGCGVPRARVSECRCCARRVCTRCLFAHRDDYRGVARALVAARGCCGVCALDCVTGACLLRWWSPHTSASSSTSYSPVVK